IVDKRSTNCATKLLPTIVWLGNPLLLVDLVVSAGRGVEDVVVSVPVNLVGAALGDAVYQAASSLAKLGFESGAGDLEFADNVFAELKGNGAPDLLRKKGVIVVSAIHSVVVEVSRDSVKTDHAKVAICCGSGSEQSKVVKL